MIDRLIALAVSLILMPLILILLFISLVVFRSNPIFIQYRTVDGNATFKFYKIRSMYSDAPLVPTSKFIDNRRYIPIWGKFIRNWSLDELLNLFSIIRGDMLFLGPRPIMTNEDELIQLRIKNNIKCKPGMSGLAQINGRDHITITKKVACERYYSRRKSLCLNFYIIFTTVKVVLRKTGISH
jgi:O-antigen biosynthesis protein WbqP